jgi:flagellar basal-body rod protein FlgB
MDTAAIPLFALAKSRLNWIEQRQALLARNLANAATPGFEPRDLKDFASNLGRPGAAAPRRTQPNHLPGPARTGQHPEITPRPHARSPDGNAVAIDEQLMKIADTETAQGTTTMIHRKYMGFFALALGRV